MINGSAYLGIDPGLDGGLAFFTDNYRTIGAVPMPTIGKKGSKRELDLQAVVRWIDSFTSHGYAIRTCTLESVHSMPKQGVVSVFNFGLSFGMLRGVLAAKQISTKLVTPQAWKKEILTGYNKQDKSGAIKYCSTVYPSVNLIPEGRRTPHDGMADAICLAEYGYVELLEESE